MKMNIFWCILFFIGTIETIARLIDHTFSFTTFNIIFSIGEVIMVFYHLKLVIDELRDRKK